MYGQQQQQQGGMLEDARRFYRVGGALIQAIGMGLEPWQRRLGTFGSHYFVSWHGAAGWVFMGFFGPWLFPLDDQQLLGAFWMLSLGLFLLHHLCGQVRRARGYKVPSRYSGSSWLPVDEGLAKRLLEPLLGIGIGIGVLGGMDRPLGAYLIVASICNGLNWQMWWAEVSAQIRAYEDSVALQDYLLWEMERRKGGG